MDWPTVVAPVARLIDIHDCGHTPGALWNTPPERRPGTESGLWLSIATSLLEYLHEKDLEANEAWIPLRGIFDDLAKQHVISEQDVLFVASYLATPSRLGRVTMLAQSELGASKFLLENADLRSCVVCSISP
jgi:hypothetical protein